MPNFWKKMKKPILAMAPMAGYTNSAFRQICKKYGADVVYSEMASAAALNYNGKKTIELLKFQRSERPYVVQLFGNEAKYFCNAAKIVSEMIKPDGIDINMGCPAKKVFGNGSGAALMNNITMAREIIKETLKGTKLPVSIKIRSNVGEMTAYKFVKSIKDLPISAIMIHGRSLSQGFAGEIDYGQIKKARLLYMSNSYRMKSERQSLDKPVVLANGGINAPEDAKVMLEKTGADGIGIARGALTKPWLFWQIKKYLEEGKYREFNLGEIKKASLQHAKMSHKAVGNHGIVEMRKYLLWYFRGFENAKKARRELSLVENIDDIEIVLKKI
jgi:tRNA-dihydrouridine synthase B